MRIIVTGGAGFIGSAVVRHFIQKTGHEVLNVDKLTYAGHLESLRDVDQDPRYRFAHLDICHREALEKTVTEFSPDAIVHLAAESHVDRSIDAPSAFIDTNVTGTYTLLEVARKHWSHLGVERQRSFRFLHVSTDEVFGSLGPAGLFHEQSPYHPNSPYAASKASADHLVRAWHNTFGLPTIQTNCSNNYGPFQFPEKLIPLMTLNAIEGKPLPVYGDGHYKRDWLYVDDHAEALKTCLERGTVGETYNIGANQERENLDVIHQICDFVDEIQPDKRLSPRRQWIRFVSDRPGHDRRYALDASKIRRELGWKPGPTFETRLKETVAWYVHERSDWVRKVVERSRS